MIDQEFADLIVQMPEQFQGEEQAEYAIERASLLTERDRLLKRKKRDLELYLDGKLSHEDYANARAETSLRLPPMESKVRRVRDRPGFSPPHRTESSRTLATCSAPVR